MPGGYDILLNDGPHYLIPEWAMFIVTLCIVAFFIIGFYMADPNRKWFQRFLIWDSGRKWGRNKEKYDQWLRKGNPYYRALLPYDQERFLHRVLVFLRTKNFHYHFITPDLRIAVLVSGAAVQLTFGLKNFVMDYFSDIHIMGKPYKIKGDSATYYGHVSLSGIHVAWDKFAEGYNDYSDSVNVGLHEMAHALSYDCFLGWQDVEDRKFRERLNEFSTSGRSIFQGMRKGDTHILSDYGATNFDEFWAVCVERFFESPVSFREDMPDLYREMSELLNQDPMTPGHLLDPKLA